MLNTNLQTKPLTSVRSNDLFTLCVSWKHAVAQGKNRGEGPVEGEHHWDIRGRITDWLKVKSLFAGWRKKCLAGGQKLWIVILDQVRE